MREKKIQKTSSASGELYPKISFRIPIETKNKIDRAVKETGLKQSAIVLACIEEGLPYVIGARAERGARLAKELAASLHGKEEMS